MDNPQLSIEKMIDLRKSNPALSDVAKDAYRMYNSILQAEYDLKTAKEAYESIMERLDEEIEKLNN